MSWPVCIKHAEYSVDGGDWTRVDPIGLLSDSMAEEYDVTIAAPAVGEHTIAVRVADDEENQAVEKVVTK